MTRTSQSKELWFKQRLNHKAPPRNSQAWRQRYYQNLKYYDAEKSGPMFVYIGGEFELDDFFIYSGFLHDMAKSSGGILFALEHRFYGKSKPTKDLSVANLKLLTAEQALADLDYFIRKMRFAHEIPCKFKVFTASGSYPGALSAWMRKEFINTVDAAWASSAVVQPIFDYAGKF